MYYCISFHSYYLFEKAGLDSGRDVCDSGPFAITFAMGIDIVSHCATARIRSLQQFCGLFKKNIYTPF